MVNEILSKSQEWFPGKAEVIDVRYVLRAVNANRNMTMPDLLIFLSAALGAGPYSGGKIVNRVSTAKEITLANKKTIIII